VTISGISSRAIFVLRDIAARHERHLESRRGDRAADKVDRLREREGVASSCLRQHVAVSLGRRAAPWARYGSRAGCELYLATGRLLLIT
jgi:hypothetical protein